MNIIQPRSGAAFMLQKNQYLLVKDIEGMQVSDMVLFSQNDIGEKLSSGKTFDFEETINLTTGNHLWSNRSNKLMYIVQDDVNSHDMLLAPCSKETFEIMYDSHETTHSCLDNLNNNLKSFGIERDQIPGAFNIFMNVQVDAEGKIAVLPPKSKANDTIVFKALTDLIVGLTACSAKDSNGGSFKPIGYKILESWI